MSDEQPQEVRQKNYNKRLKAYQDVFNSPLGAAVLKDMIKAHGILDPHPVDPQEMALREGERMVVLRILRLLKTKPQDLIERINDETI